jgi:hypothetical protein
LFSENTVMSPFKFSGPDSDRPKPFVELTLARGQTQGTRDAQRRETQSVSKPFRLEYSRSSSQSCFWNEAAGVTAHDSRDSTRFSAGELMEPSLDRI